MIFNSLEFAIFLPLVFVAYWLIGEKHVKAQNFFLLMASYLFYGWWDYRFLGLIIFSSIVDYFIAIGIEEAQSQRKKKILLSGSLLVNLGLLGVFKYYNFFLDNLVGAFESVGYTMHASSLQIILPVGISFYTFQTLSYSIDVYRGQMKAVRRPFAFLAYVSFFPQLVAGPIERASNLLPQFTKGRSFKPAMAKDGLRQILWGLFKKVVIADTCAILANDIFNNYQQYNSAVLVLGAIYFAFQIYCDFSGYSDIAIGTARLFGFDLMRNFAYPYFSRDIAEFWRRWHISLSTWFRDYLYIPLGGSKGSFARTIRNTFIIFVVSGFWHGANWTFIVWGALNALYFLPLLLAKKNRRFLGDPAEGRIFPGFKEALSILFTFGLTTLAWVFFRAENVQHAMAYLGRIAELDFSLTDASLLKYLPLIGLLLLWEWFSRFREHGLRIDRFPLAVRWSVYYGLIGMILYFFGEEQQFIYFQF